MRYGTGKKIEAWTPSALPELLTPLEVAERCRVTRRTVYRWIEAGRIKPQRVGDKLVLIPVTEVQRFLAESNAGQNLPVVPVPGSNEESVDDEPEWDARKVQAATIAKIQESMVEDALAMDAWSYLEEHTAVAPPVAPSALRPMSTQKKTTKRRR